MEVKVEVEARDTEESVKGKHVHVKDLEFIQGPINLASLSPIQELKLVALSQDKASEDLLKSHTNDSELLTLASGVLEKLMPSFQKDTSDTPFDQMKSLINSVDNHFESFEKSPEEKVCNEFNARRLQKLKRIIVDGRVTLDMCVKSMQDSLFEDGNIYKSCLTLPKFTQDIEKKSKEHEDQLAQMSQSFDLLSVSMSSYEDQVISLVEKIRSLSQENRKYNWKSL